MSWSQTKKDSVGLQPVDSTQRADTTKHKKDSLSKNDLAKMKRDLKLLSHNMDSASAKGLPVATYQKKMDSIQKRLSSHLSLAVVSNSIKASNKKLQRKIDKRTARLQKKINAKKGVLDSLGFDAKDPTSQLKVPQKNPPGASTKLPSVADTRVPTTKTPSVIPGMLPKSQLDIPGLKEVNQVSSEIKKASESVSKEVKEIKQIEGAASKEIKTINKETGEI
ncbi:MAG TPA: hypothetical protein VGQ59_06180, partial [Cyclobacteriaceae bacterium]|nr:hypothetical protein [Cyclobacteriaceae bacterium]